MPFPARIDPATIGERALEVVEERGWDSWSLRDVARHLGVSPTALYRHVDSREGLHVEIAAAAAIALAATLRRRGLPPSGVERVVTMSRRYIRFGVRRPHAYAAFMLAKPAPEHPSIGPWLDLWGFVRDEVTRVVPDAGDAAAFALWAFLHGRVQLALGAGRGAPPEAGIEDAVTAIMTGYASMGRVPSPLPAGLRNALEAR